MRMSSQRFVSVSLYSNDILDMSSRTLQGYSDQSRAKRRVGLIMKKEAYRIY